MIKYATRPLISPVSPLALNFAYLPTTPLKRINNQGFKSGPKTTLTNHYEVVLGPQVSKMHDSATVQALKSSGASAVGPVACQVLRPRSQDLAGLWS